VKLHSPTFEKELRRGVAEAVRSNPLLQVEFRRSDKRPRRRWMAGIIRVLASFLLAGLVWRATLETHPVDSALTVIDLWILTTTVSFTRRLLSLPIGSRDITALRLLPVPEAVIFDWEFDKFRRSTLFLLGDGTAGFSALALILHLSPIQWIAMLVLIPVTVTFILALTALFAARFYLVPFDFIFSGLCLIWVFVFVGAKATGPWVQLFIHDAGPIFNLVVPTGWPLCLFHLMLPGANWLFAIFIAPVGLILWTYKSSVQILRARFVYEEPIIDLTDEANPEEDSTARVGSMEDGSQPVQWPMGVTAIAEDILSGQLLIREEWNQGWLERILWRWLNPREKTVAEFAFPAGPALTQAWKKVLRLFVIVSLVGLAAGLFSSVLSAVLFAIGFLIISFQTMLPLYGAGSAFNVIFNNGLQIPVYAAYPISFRTLSRTLLKCSAIQMPLFVLLVAASIILLSHFSELSITMAIVVGINAGLVFWGGRFFLLVFGFSSGSGDAASISLRSITLLAFFALFGLLFLCLAVFDCVFVIESAITGILSELQLILWIVSFLALLVAYAFFRIYGWVYNTCRFDLIRASP
jgi:hypothetical protein